MNLFLIYFIIALPFITFGDNNLIDHMELFSEKVKYDGQDLKFDGNVSLSHPLGKLKSEKASLQKIMSKEKNNIFSSIILENDVQLDLKNGGILRGDRARYNIDSKEMEFTKSKNSVLYADTIKQKNRSSIPYNISSDKVISTYRSHKKDDVILKFIDDVNMTFKNGYQLHGNEAIYTNDNISIYPDSSNTFCKITAADLSIFSKSIVFTFSSSSLYFQKPFGTIKHEIEFSSDSLYYLENDKKLSLRENAILKNGNMSLSCNSIDIYRNDKQIEKVVASDDTTIIFDNSKNSKIICISPLTYDYINKNLYTSPIDKKAGLFYKDNDIFMYSKKASFNLSESNNVFEIKTAILEDDIFFVINDIIDNPSYAVADKITYLQDKNIFILESSNNKKVLLTRKDNSLSLSATMIEIHHKGNGNDDIIKGVGVVRCKLNNVENLKIQESINKYKDRYETR